MLLNPKNPFKRIFLLILFVLIGVFTYKDFGISMDESGNRDTAFINLNFIAYKFDFDSTFIERHFKSPRELPSLDDYVEEKMGRNEHGPLFSIISFVIERIVHYPSSIHEIDEKDAYQIYHLVLHFYFLIGIACFYSILKKRVRIENIAILGVLMLYLTPRIFAESFYNSYDIAFLAAYVINIKTLIMLMRQPSVKNLALHSLCTAIAIDIRIMGIVMLPITFVVGALTTFSQPLTKQVRFVIYFTIYLLGTSLITYIFWPWLWISPVDHFKQAFRIMSHIPNYETWNLYFGQEFSSKNVPWHFTLGWILVTVPVINILLFFVGVFGVLKKLIKHPFCLKIANDQNQDLLILLLFLGPILATIIFHSNLFDGWRHLYFVYPCFIYIACIGIEFLKANFTRQKLVKILYISIIISLGSNALWIIKTHPYQNLYFNFLVPGDLLSKFDLDYWGLTNAKAIREILAADHRPIIKIAQIGNPAFFDYLRILDKKGERSRVYATHHPEYADYLINTYRWVRKDPSGGYPGFHFFRHIFVDGKPVSAVFQRDSVATIDIPKLGEPIYFTKDSPASKYLLGVGGASQIGEGWSFPEGWGVWSNARHAKVLVPIPLEDFNTLAISLILLQSLKNHGEIEIYVDGKLAQDLVGCDKGNQELRIPKSKLNIQKGFIEIIFNANKLSSPFELGLSADRRLLGVGLQSVRFN